MFLLLVFVIVIGMPNRLFNSIVLVWFRFSICMSDFDLRDIVSKQALHLKHWAGKRLQMAVVVQRWCWGEDIVLETAAWPALTETDALSSQTRWSYEDWSFLQDKDCVIWDFSPEWWQTTGLNRHRMTGGSITKIGRQARKLRKTRWPNASPLNKLSIYCIYPPVCL